MKKIIGLMLLSMLVCLCACQKNESTPELSGRVAILAPDTVVLSQEVVTHATNVEEVLVETCQTILAELPPHKQMAGFYTSMVKWRKQGLNSSPWKIIF